MSFNSQPEPATSGAVGGEVTIRQFGPKIELHPFPSVSGDSSELTSSVEIERAPNKLEPSARLGDSYPGGMALGCPDFRSSQSASTIESDNESVIMQEAPKHSSSSSIHSDYSLRPRQNIQFPKYFINSPIKKSFVKKRDRQARGRQRKMLFSSNSVKLEDLKEFVVDYDLSSLDVKTKKKFAHIAKRDIWECVVVSLEQDNDDPQPFKISYTEDRASHLHGGWITAEELLDIRAMERRNGHPKAVQPRPDIVPLSKKKPRKKETLISKCTKCRSVGRERCSCNRKVKIQLPSRRRVSLSAVPPKSSINLKAIARYVVPRAQVTRRSTYAHIAKKDVWLCKVLLIDNTDEDQPFQIEYTEERASHLHGGWIPAGELLFENCVELQRKAEMKLKRKRRASGPPAVRKVKRRKLSVKMEKKRRKVPNIKSSNRSGNATPKPRSRQPPATPTSMPLSTLREQNGTGRKSEAHKKSRARTSRTKYTVATPEPIRPGRTIIVGNRHLKWGTNITEMTDSTDLYTSDDWAALRDRLDSDGFLLVRAVAPRIKCVAARMRVLRHCMEFGATDSSEPLMDAAIHQGSGGRFQPGFAISAQAGLEALERDFDPAAWHAIGNSRELTNIYHGAALNGFLEKLFDVPTGVAPSSGVDDRVRVKMLPEQTWIRLKEHMDATVSHADYYYFKRDTKIFDCTKSTEPMCGDESQSENPSVARSCKPKETPSQSSSSSPTPTPATDEACFAYLSKHHVSSVRRSVSNLQKFLGIDRERAQRLTSEFVSHPERTLATRDSNNSADPQILDSSSTCESVSSFSHSQQSENSSGSSNLSINGKCLAYLAKHCVDSKDVSITDMMRECQVGSKRARRNIRQFQKNPARWLYLAKNFGSEDPHDTTPSPVDVTVPMDIEQSVAGNVERVTVEPDIQTCDTCCRSTTCDSPKFVFCTLCGKSWHKNCLPANIQAAIDVKHFAAEGGWHCAPCADAYIGVYTVWTCLSDKLAPFGSSLAMCPGTHKLDGYSEPIRDSQVPGDYERSMPWEIPSQLSLGDIMIFNIKTVHAASKNLSSVFRFSVDTRLMLTDSNGKLVIKPGTKRLC
eukprot:97625_1